MGTHGGVEGGEVKNLLMRTLLLLVLLMLGLGIAVSAAPSPSGEDLFEKNCASCHGYEGRGDGPTAAMFDPRPANLTAPRLKHGNSDADLFNTISKGVPGTVMQAWQPKFSDAQIRELIAYIKELRKAPPPKK